MMIRANLAAWTTAAALATGSLVAMIVAACMSADSTKCQNANAYCPPGYECRGEGRAVRCIYNGPEDCGNGRQEGRETCDDNNRVSGDGCNSNCRLETCGDGIIQSALMNPEECDCGTYFEVTPPPQCLGKNNSDAFGICTTDCKLHCGDGRVNRDELCDGTPSDHCTDYGFDFGSLACNDSCNAVVFDGCATINWQPLPSGTLEGLKAVWGSSNSEVFAIGDGATMLRFEERRWTPIPLKEWGIAEVTALWSNSFRGAVLGAKEDSGAAALFFAVNVQGELQWQKLRVTGDSCPALRTDRDEDVSIGEVAAIAGSDNNNINIFAVTKRGEFLQYCIHSNAWNRLAEPASDRPFTDVWAPDPEYIYVSGATGDIWSYLPSSPEGDPVWSRTTIPGIAAVHGLWGVGVSHLFAIAESEDGSSVVLRKEDSGWTTMLSTGPGLNRIWGSGPEDIYVFGETMLWRYDGSGWIQLDYPATTAIRDMWGSDATNIFAVGDGGVSFRFQGNLWMRTELPPDRHFLSVWGSEVPNVIAVGTESTMVRYDGTDWQPLDAPSSADMTLTEVWGQGDELFVAATEPVNGSAVIRVFYREGPADWQELTQPSLAEITAGSALGSATALWASGPSDIYLGGDFGLAHYDGTTWSRVGDPNMAVSAIWGTSASLVFAVGPGGRILRYSGTWDPVNCGTTRDLNSVWGSSTTEVFAVGEGVILHLEYQESDGAWACQEMPSPEIARWTEVRGSSGQDIFVIGTGPLGFVAEHYDGQRWNPIRQPSFVTEHTSLWVDQETGDVFFVGPAGSTERFSRGARRSMRAD